MLIKDKYRPEKEVRKGRDKGDRDVERDRARETAIENKREVERVRG